MTAWWCATLKFSGGCQRVCAWPDQFKKPIIMSVIFTYFFSSWDAIFCHRILNRSKLVNWTGFNKRSVSELSKMLASAEAEIGEGVYWMVQKKKKEREGKKWNYITVHWPLKDPLSSSYRVAHLHSRRMSCRPRPATASVHYKLITLRLASDNTQPSAICSTPAFTTGLRTPTLLTERAWQPSTGAQPSAGTPSLKSGWWRKGRVKRIVAPTESKVNSVVYVGNLRMYLDTSVQVTCCTGCFLLHWTASCSSSPGTVNSLLETAACCL